MPTLIKDQVKGREEEGEDNVLTKPTFEGLTIGSVKAEESLEKIKARKCTGYLKIEFYDLRFLLFFEDGIPTYGFRVVEGQLFSFSGLADVLHSLQDGRITFFETSPGVLQAILDMKFGKKVYGDLYTSFTNVRKLFILLKQEKLTGSVEIDLPSIRSFVVMEEGVPQDVLSCPEQEKGEVTLECVLDRATSQDGVVRVFERRNPPSVLHPDLEQVFMWSDPRRLKLEFAFGQLGKEFEELLDRKMTVSQILDALYVDFEEIADMYTYLSAKGYIAVKNVMRTS